MKILANDNNKNEIHQIRKQKREMHDAGEFDQNTKLGLLAIIRVEPKALKCKRTIA